MTIPITLFLWRKLLRAEKLTGEIALCGGGLGASIAANKVVGVRAGLIHDVFSAHQGVEDDDVNMFCLGGKVIGSDLAWELLERFLLARFSYATRHRRRLAKVRALEWGEGHWLPTSGRDSERFDS